MKVKLLFTAIIFTVLLSKVGGQQIGFKWEKDSLNGKLIDKIAMSATFTIENKTYPFHFDLGADYDDL